MRRPHIIFPLILLAAPLALAADAPIHGIPMSDIDNPTIDIDLISIESQWTPFSRSYEGFPGKFIISKNTISFGNCKQPFTVVRDNTREDSLWNGTDVARNIKRYRDISIKVLPNPTCDSAQEQVFRFLISQGNPCSAILMLYTSEKDLQDGHWVGWGSYSSCHIRGIKSH
jgi:hypothetical protein